MFRLGLLRALESKAQIPIVPILGEGIMDEALLRSAEADAEPGLLALTRREVAGVRPRTVRPSFEAVFDDGGDEVAEAEGPPLEVVE